MDKVPAHVPTTNETDVEPPKKKIKESNIPVSEMVHGAMPPADVQKEEAKDKKNDVEVYVNDMRNKLHDKLQEFVTEQEKEAFYAKLQETEDWLHEVGEDETQGIYIAKLHELKKQGDSIEQRYKEHSKKGSAREYLVYLINSYKLAARPHSTTYEHIDLSEKQKVLSECEQVQNWLREKERVQDSLPKHANPILLSSDIRSKAEALRRVCMSLLNPTTPSSPEPAQGGEEQPPALGMENANADDNPDAPTAMETEKPEAADKELEMVLQDRIVEESKDKKIIVEAYVNDMRNKLLHDKLQEFVTDSEREAFTAKLQEIEIWLHAKLDELMKQADPIEQRYKVHKERESAILDLHYLIDSFRLATILDDLSEEKKVLRSCELVENWLSKKKQEQDSLPKHADPVLQSSHIRRKAELLERVCKPLLKQKRPTPRNPATPSSHGHAQGGEQPPPALGTENVNSDDNDNPDAPTAIETDKAQAAT